MSHSPLIAHLVFAAFLLQALSPNAHASLSCGNLTCPTGSCGPKCNTEKTDKCDGTNMFDAYSGNVHRSITDISLFGSVGGRPLTFTRDSNSRMVPMNNAAGAFGRETLWTHNHLWHMRNAGTAANGQPVVRIGMPDGYDESFVRNPSDHTVWLPVANSRFSVRQNGNIFEHGDPDGGIARFERRTHTSSGAIFYRIAEVEDVSGNIWNYSYNTANETVVRQVTDASGRWLKFTYINAGNFEVQTANLAPCHVTTRKAPGRK